MPRDLAFDFLATAAAELRAQSKTGMGVPAAVDGWTPERAGEALVAALKWAHHSAGRVGPGGMVSARLPEAVLSPEDHAAAGWGLPETADDPNEERPIRLQLSAAEVSRLEDVLAWPARYLCPAHSGSARIVGLWAAYKARKRPFDAAIKARGTIAKATAYRMRDKGLRLIAQGLERDRVPFFREEARFVHVY